MPKNPSRALRRHHRKRLKRRRAHYWNGTAGATPRRAGRCLHSPASCSCWLCGNRRRHHGETLQEQRFAQTALWEPDDA